MSTKPNLPRCFGHHKFDAQCDGDPERHAQDPQNTEWIPCAFCEQCAGLVVLAAALGEPAPPLGAKLSTKEITDLAEVGKQAIAVKAFDRLMMNRAERIHAQEASVPKRGVAHPKPVGMGNGDPYAKTLPIALAIFQGIAYELGLNLYEGKAIALQHHLYLSRTTISDSLSVNLRLLVRLPAGDRCIAYCRMRKTLNSVDLHIRGMDFGDMSQFAPEFLPGAGLTLCATPSWQSARTGFEQRIAGIKMPAVTAVAREFCRLVEMKWIRMENTDRERERYAVLCARLEKGRNKRRTRK